MLEGAGVGEGLEGVSLVQDFVPQTKPNCLILPRAVLPAAGGDSYPRRARRKPSAAVGLEVEVFVWLAVFPALIVLPEVV